MRAQECMPSAHEHCQRDTSGSNADAAPQSSPAAKAGPASPGGQELSPEERQKPRRQ